MRYSEATVPQSISQQKALFQKTEESVQEEDVTAREADSDTKKEVQIWRKYPTKAVELLLERKLKRI
jgi:hypothetical protein